MSEKVLNSQEASAILNAMSELPDKKCITAIEAQEMLSNMSVIPIDLAYDLGDGNNILFCNFRSGWGPGFINIDNNGNTDEYDMQESGCIKVLSIRGDMASATTLEVQSEQEWDQAIMIAYPFSGTAAKSQIYPSGRQLDFNPNMGYDGRIIGMVIYN